MKKSYSNPELELLKKLAYIDRQRNLVKNFIEIFVHQDLAPAIAILNDVIFVSIQKSFSLIDHNKSIYNLVIYSEKELDKDDMEKLIVFKDNFIKKNSCSEIAEINIKYELYKSFKNDYLINKPKLGIIHKEKYNSLTENVKEFILRKSIDKKEFGNFFLLTY